MHETPLAECRQFFRQFETKEGHWNIAFAKYFLSQVQAHMCWCLKVWRTRNNGTAFLFSLFLTSFFSLNKSSVLYHFTAVVVSATLSLYISSTVEVSEAGMKFISLNMTRLLYPLKNLHWPPRMDDKIENKHDRKKVIQGCFFFRKKLRSQNCVRLK